MTGAATNAALVVGATPQGFSELAAATAGFDEQLAKRLRTNIRGAAILVVSAIRTNVLSGGYATDDGMRQGIADGLKVQVEASKARPGASIIATPRSMPDGKALMVKAWQKRTFKHPVYGDQAVLVEQAGRPYFDESVKANQAKVTTAVTRAMQEAADTLSRSRI